ncbi:S41 family peptidase [Dyella sp. C11]|uniref:S41 family peptidase n=1 Tax=Dyella sp. C11 TaxID=2126991 RepID=UPI000D648BFE|nr:S41 family peptidase [Dyella sp. C11]
MRHGWTAIGTAYLLAFSVQAQDTSLEARYAHLQALNNQAYSLIDAQPRDPRKLAQAAELLRQSLTAEEQLRPTFRDNAFYEAAGESRHNDATLMLARAYALQGDKEQALSTLEALTKESFVGSYRADEIAKDEAFADLRHEPRYQAVMASYRRLDTLWNAPAIATSSTELDEAQRVAGLSLFWSEARYNFVHFDHVPDLDWNQAYLDFLPKVMAAKNLHDYYDVMMQFAPLLHDGHTNIYPPKSIQNEFYARPPVRTAWIDGRVLVTAVRSPALASEVKVGDEVRTIDGQDVRAYAREHVAPYASSSTPQDADVRAYDYQLLQGDHRKPVTLGLQGASGPVRQVTLSREKDPQTQRAPSFEWRMLPGGVAYLALNEFEDEDGVKAFERALPEILKAKGLILDVRQNGGGSDLMAANILSYLTDQPIPGAQTRSPEYVPVFRANSGPYMSWMTLSPGSFEKERKQHYRGPVVLLIGPRTYSAAEDFVAAFDSIKRGTLVGEATGGSTGAPLEFNLPGGGSARVCAKHDAAPDGREFVGKGMAPAIVVAPTVADIRAGRDPVLERAVALLTGKLPAASPAAP